jgi:hypothetical protein
MWKNCLEPDEPLMTIWHMCIAFWVPKATKTLVYYVMLLLSHDKNCNANAPQYYVILTLPVLSYISVERLLHQEIGYAGGPVEMRPDYSCLDSDTTIQESSGLQWLGTEVVCLESIATAQCGFDILRLWTSSLYTANNNNSGYHGREHAYCHWSRSTFLRH